MGHRVVDENGKVQIVKDVPSRGDPQISGAIYLRTGDQDDA
jgi:hypothetical protein